MKITTSFYLDFYLKKKILVLYLCNFLNRNDEKFLN